MKTSFFIRFQQNKVKAEERYSNNILLTLDWYFSAWKVLLTLTVFTALY